MKVEELYSIYLKHPVISTDSRQTPEGCIFFALKGEKFNGNKYASKALENGAAMAVVDEPCSDSDKRHIRVENVLESLQQLAIHHRRQFSIPFIGITGTNGKTTSKELVASVLSQQFKTCFTQGNLNNHIGVPLTILSITDDTQIAVIEMGANHIGEIAQLCEISQPDYGLITNIGKAHLEGFGNFEGVKKTKKELYDYVERHGKLIFVDGDNQLLLSISQNIQKKTYGAFHQLDTNAKIVGMDPFIHLSWKNKHIKSNLIGSYNFYNILSAICIGEYFGVSDADIIKGIESYIPKNNRSQMVETAKNQIVLDAYNANPTSMKAALETFAQLDVERKVCILGDMLELGEYAQDEHQEIMKLVDSLGFKEVFYIGPVFKSLSGDSEKSFYLNSDALDYLKENSIENSTILIKGSRGIKLEILTEVL